MTHLTVEEIILIREALLRDAKNLSKKGDHSDLIERLNAVANKIIKFETK